MKSGRFAAGASLLPLGLLLAACGGGGVNSTPTPTPTPAPSYTAYSGLSGAQSFQQPSIKYVHDDFSALTPVEQSVLTYAGGVKYIIDFGANTIKATAPGSAQVSFAASEQVGTPTPGSWTSYIKYDGLARPTYFMDIFVPTVAGVPMSYTRFGSFGFRNYDGDTANITTYGGCGGFFGVATQAGDFPVSGTATYSSEVSSGSATRYSGQVDQGIAFKSTATFSANFGAGTVSTLIHLIGDSLAGYDDFGNFTGSGSIASGGPGFSGTLTGPSSSTGAFSGAFFGPQGQEMGYSFYVESSAFNAGGAVVGKKN